MQAKTQDSETTSAASAGSSSRRRVALRALQVTAGLVLGFALSEAAFSARDDAAFPHANFYQADAELGVRLVPGSTMRFRLGSNPTSQIRVNAQGYRGADWPEPKPADNDEVLVLGDSQVFGLGVNDEETASAVLAQLSGRSVLNAGVPTYGPAEYLATAQEVLEKRKPKTVVYILNFLNDPFELGRPNAERHRVWDGWAVRSETAPDVDSLVSYPGRPWLMSKSHLVYNLRRWWHERDDESRAKLAAADHGVPSEGVWEDLLAAEAEVSGEATLAAQAEANARHAEQVAQSERVRQVEFARAQADDPLKSAREARDAKVASIDAQLEQLDKQTRRYRRHRGNEKAILAANPGDIIRDRSSEASRKITVTAQMYQEAVKSQKARRAYEHERKALRTQRRMLLSRELTAPTLPPAEVAPEPHVDALAVSVFEPHLAQLKALCDRHGAELLVVALPFDVQVSSEEWAKYGVSEGPDMSGTLVLLEDLVVSATRLGIASLDLTMALRESGAGSFLDGDIHLTAKGQAAAGRAIDEALSGLGDPAK